jgi:hypothetical protein
MDGSAQGWREAKEQTAEQRRREREQKYAPVEMNFVRARQAAGPECRKRACTNSRK